MKHNTSTSKKKALRGLAVGLALALTIAGGGLLSHRYGWFGDTPTAELPENPSKNPETGDTVTVTPGIQRGIKLTTKAFKTERGTTAQLITATITPEDTADKSVSWKIGFVNPAASWAAGKNAEDYVTMTPSGSQATVECDQAFGEQIVITVTAQANTDVSAECTLDYVKRVMDITFAAKKGGATYSGNSIDFTDKVNEAAAYVSRTPVYSVYTIDDTFTFATLEATQTMLDKFTAYAKTVDAEFENTYAEERREPWRRGVHSGNYYELLNSIISFNRFPRARASISTMRKNEWMSWNGTSLCGCSKVLRRAHLQHQFMRLNVTYTGKSSSYTDYVSYKLGTITADIRRHCLSESRCPGITNSNRSATRSYRWRWRS
ncbi:MAG: hypothetical protein ACLS4Z_08695 [Christensenellaceae bacterium]